jgi:hypothetical protein
MKDLILNLRNQLVSMIEEIDNYSIPLDDTIFIKKEDLKRVKYICSESKIQKENNQNTLVSSRICSKIQ